jgi:hypothetical protein
MKRSQKYFFYFILGLSKITFKFQYCTWVCVGGEGGSDDYSVVFHIEIFPKKRFPTYLPYFVQSRYRNLQQILTMLLHKFYNKSSISLFLAPLNCLKGIY